MKTTQTNLGSVNRLDFRPATIITFCALPGIVLIVFVLAPIPILSLFSREEAILLSGGSYMRLRAISSFSLVINIPLAAVLRGSRKSRYPLYASYVAMSLAIAAAFGMDIAGELTLRRLQLVAAGVLPLETVALAAIAWLLHRKSVVTAPSDSCLEKLSARC